VAHIVILPEEVNIYILLPPLSVMVGEPVVEVAAGYADE
jgi:hypothetical protein